MNRRPLLTLTITVLSTLSLFAQNSPKFEEASLKPAEACTLRNSIDPGRVSFTGDPLSILLMEAFQVKADQIIGPGWIANDCFTLVAKFPTGATRAQLPQMLQALLTERFQLRLHRETRPRPGYALSVDPKGSKLKPSNEDAPLRGLKKGQAQFGFGPDNGAIAGSMTMTTLARLLSTRLRSPVEDATQLTGTYDVDLQWSLDSALETAETASAMIAATSFRLSAQPSAFGSKAASRTSKLL